MKTMPPAIKILIEDPALAIDGFLCPGHVSTITGTEAYKDIIKAGRSAVITGFEPVDILEGIYLILEQIINDTKKSRFSTNERFPRRETKRHGTSCLKFLKPVLLNGEASATFPEADLSLKMNTAVLML